MVNVARKSRVNLAALAAVAGLTSLSSASYALTFVWTAGAAPDFSWNNPANWNLNSGAPGASDIANWSGVTPTPTTVDLTEPEAASAINVNDRVVQFNLNNFTLAVGSQSNIDGDNSNAIFNGPGNVTFAGLLQLGFDNVGPVSTHATVTAQNGAQVATSGGLLLGAYRTGGLVKVDGAGTVWNSTSPVTFVTGASPYRTFTQPRAQLLITNGAVFNHNLGTNGTNTFTVARGSNRDAYIQVDGAGSQLNFTGNYGSNLIIGGYSSNTTWDITNGGVLSNTADMGPSFVGGYSGINTFNINGTNSKMSANTITLAGRSTSDFGRDTTVVNVGVGGLLQATSADGADRSIVVGDRGTLALQGGTVSVPTGKTINLRSAGVGGGLKATLEGFGTISGGSLVAEQNTRITPGIAGAGTIRITSGNLTTGTGATPTELDFDLQTTTNNPHDMLALDSLTSNATIGNNSTDAITYSVLGGGNLAAGASGFMDFLIGETVNYGGTTLLGDVPNIDNLPALLAAAGYTRVSGLTTPTAGQYSYFLTTVSPTDYDGMDAGEEALRLEFAPPPAVPEPASLAVLALGGLTLLRRRRS